MDITVQELRQKLESGEDFLLLDVREPYEFDEFNLGGQLMPLGVLPARIWEIEDHKGDELVVYCRSGGRSGMAKGLLEAQGFSHVRNLTGGVLAWLDAFGPTKP